MEYVTLGRTGLKVSRLAFGNMPFGSQVDLETGRRLVQRCLDAGINFFDTADVYNGGRAESMLGEVLGTRRNDIVLASKVRGRMGEDPNREGLSRRWIVQAVEESLKRLGTDHLDIYYMHQPDYSTPVEETLRALDELVQAGKILHVGVSNYAAWQMAQMLGHCEAHRLTPPTVVQPMLNLLARGVESEGMPFCREFGLAVFTYNPLAGGLLTGKHDRTGAPAAGTRFDGNPMYQKRYWHPEMFEAVDRLSKIASDAGRSMIELSLRWCLQQPGVTGVILGATSEKQLDKNLSACEGSLDPSTMARCDEVWASFRGPVPNYNR